MFAVLSKIRDALTAIPNLAVYHYYAPSSEDVAYCVWYEDSEASSLEADNHKEEQAIEGYVDYFTRQDYDPKVDAIQNALNGIENCAWRFESVIYGDPTDEHTNSYHYTWSWRIA